VVAAIVDASSVRTIDSAALLAVTGVLVRLHFAGEVITSFRQEGNGMMPGTLLFGTIILAIWTPAAVWVGVDSKVISVSSTIKTEPYQPKIHRQADVVFAHAGLFKDALGKFDIVAEEVAYRFTLLIEPQFLPFYRTSSRQI
jgi:hypothetical protein